MYDFTADILSKSHCDRNSNARFNFFEIAPDSRDVVYTYKKLFCRKE